MVALIRTKAVITSPISGGPHLTQQVWQPGTGGGSVADATDCLGRFRAAWNALATGVCTGYGITFNPTVDVFDSATGDLTGQFTGTPPAAISFSGGAAPLPAQVQGLVAWNTSIVRRGRFLRGRSYIPGADEALNTASGVPSAAYIGVLNNYITAMLATGATASTLQVWGRPTTPGGSDGVAGPVSGGVARATWSTQRRRAL